jgi:hypothetical protein
LVDTLTTIEKMLKKADNNPKRIKIQIRCHRDCECRHVTQLFESLSKLGIMNVRSAVAD